MKSTKTNPETSFEALAEEAHDKRVKNASKVFSELQLRGKGGSDPVDKFTRDAKGLVGGPSPGITKRQKRNKLNSKNKGRPISPEKKMVSRMAQATAGKGAANCNYGQTSRSIRELFARIQNGSLTEEFVSLLEGKDLILQVLRSLYGKCQGGWRQDENLLVNEDGSTADASKWQLLGDFLVNQNGQYLDSDLIREAIEALEYVPAVVEQPVDADQIELFNTLVLKKLGL